MDTKRLNCGFEMPFLGIGTFTFGGEHDTDNSKDKEWILAIKDALELGYVNIDTAEVYGGGHTEELVAKAIEGFDRQKLFITTKVYHTHFRYDDVIKSAKASIERLKSDYIDLYLLHSFNPNIPLRETMEAMNKLVDLGLIRNIGVCNFNSKQLQEAQKYSKAKIVVNQLKFNLWANTGPDVDTFAYCQNNDIMVTAYKLFGRDKIKSDKIPLLAEIGNKYNMADAQVMIAWVLSKKNFVAIFTSMNKDHLKSNMAALKVKIDKKDIDRLDEELLMRRFKR
jgi:diketogulonate reductase-like aldo/keto reductase